MSTDESRQLDNIDCRVGQMVAKGLADGIVPTAELKKQHGFPYGPFELTFYDYAKMRQVTVSSAVMINRDIPYLRELLAALRPELRVFILESAKLICEAGE